MKIPSKVTSKMRLFVMQTKLLSEQKNKGIIITSERCSFDFDSHSTVHESVVQRPVLDRADDPNSLTNLPPRTRTGTQKRTPDA